MEELGKLGEDLSAIVSSSAVLGVFKEPGGWDVEQ